MLIPGVKDSSVATVITTCGMHGFQIDEFSSPASPATTAWPLANRAYYIPIYVSSPVIVKEMFFMTGTTPGTTTFDLGIYDENFVRLVNLGSTACVNTTDAIMPVGGGDITDTPLAPGRYYAAMSSAAITLDVRAAVNGNSIMRALGLMMQETAHPLPATATPVSVGTAGAFMPHVGLGLITNVL